MNLVEYTRINGEYISTIRKYLCEEMPGGRLMWDKYEYKLRDKYFNMETFSDIDTWIQERRKEEDELKAPKKLVPAIIIPKYEDVCPEQGELF